MDPLPNLGTGDFGGGGVFHQPVDRSGTRTVEPGIHVADADFDIGFQPGFGDRPGGGLHVE